MSGDLVEILNKTSLITRFEKVMPAGMHWDTQFAFALQQLRKSDYILKIATHPDGERSLIQAVFNVAAIGLSLNPAEGLAYLIPRKGVICLDPSYKGLVKLATDTGNTLWVQAKCVYANDEYTNTGVDTKPIHIYNPFEPDRGAFIGCYCTVKTRDGSYLTTEMPGDEVIMIRDKSSESHKGGKGSPWDDWFEEMAKKTVIRRASKLWPRSAEPNPAEQRMYEAVDISNVNEGLELTTSNPVGAGQYSDAAKAHFDQLIAQSNAAGMVVLQQTTEQKDFTALYHSFEKGSKGRNQQVVDELLRSGYAMAEEYAELVSVCVSDGGDLDELLGPEQVGELFDLVKERVSNEVAMAMEKENANHVQQD